MQENMRRLLVFIILVIFVSSYLYAKPLRNPRIRRNAYRNKGLLWPKGIVPYTVDDNFSESEREVIQRAMDDIHSVSCVRFKKRSDETGYVEMLKSTSCWAIIGYWGGPQNLTLSSYCMTVGTVIHELFHSLGFFHEHTRPDRDEYVTVQESNIKANELYNFKKMSPSVVTTLDLPYDFNSVLHYASWSHAINDSQLSLKPVALNIPLNFGNPEKMSKWDVLKLNKLYSCPEDKIEVDVIEEDEGSGSTAAEASSNGGLSGLELEELLT